MKILIQRVLSASVSVDNCIISSIGKGLCVFVGIAQNDSDKDLEHLVRKLLNIRLFENDEGKKWQKNVCQQELEILCVSQFTLESVLKGNKPDFHNAMATQKSYEFYSKFLHKLRTEYRADRIKDGKFGVYMTVNIQNDGPVSIILESSLQ